MTTVAAQIAELGKLMYGSHWQTDLARDIGLDARKVRYWLSGQREPTRADLLKVRTQARRRLTALAMALE